MTLSPVSGAPPAAYAQEIAKQVADAVVEAVRPHMPPAQAGWKEVVRYETGLSVGLLEHPPIPGPELYAPALAAQLAAQVAPLYLAPVSQALQAHDS